MRKFVLSKLMLLNNTVRLRIEQELGRSCRSTGRWALPVRVPLAVAMVVVRRREEERIRSGRAGAAADLVPRRRQGRPQQRAPPCAREGVGCGCRRLGTLHRRLVMPVQQPPRLGADPALSLPDLPHPWPSLSPRPRGRRGARVSGALDEGREGDEVAGGGGGLGKRSSAGGGGGWIRGGIR